MTPWEKSKSFKIKNKLILHKYIIIHNISLIDSLRYIY